MTEMRRWPDWLQQCSDEDLAFIRRLVLASGSLKEIAGQYDVSYPTFRLRLDRLIEKIHLVEKFSGETAVEQGLRLAYAEGRMNLATLKSLLALYRSEKGDGVTKGEGHDGVRGAMKQGAET